MRRINYLFIIIILGSGLICTPARAFSLSTSAQAVESAAAFYRGKVVEFVVPYSPGGGYDTQARLLLPFLEKHLGTTVIVRNEPGAGGKVALNRLAKETNGLSIVMFSPRDAAIAQIFGTPGVKFDLTKFNWLGTVSQDEYAVVTGKKSGYTSIPDLRRAKEVKFGAGSKTSDKAIRPLVMGHVLGINVKIVLGYRGTADELLAVQKGEIDGESTTVLSLLPYINSHDVVPLLLMGRERSKHIPDIPTLFEVKKLSAPEQRIADISIALDATGRVVATTPGVSGVRVAFLKNALTKSLEEPELLQRIGKLNMTINYVTGKETAENIKEILSIGGDEKRLFGKLLGMGGH